MTKEGLKKCDMRRTCSDSAGFEDGGRGPCAKEFRRPQEAGKGEEMNFLLGSPERSL